jgi:glyoxylase-like metal-dependent hydrolase (beta-lactamase superfamily II)
MKISILIFALCYTFSLSAKVAAPKLTITRIIGNFYVFTTYKNYKGTLFPANGMYVITSQGAVLIDTPWDTTQLQPLLDSISNKHNTNAVLCIATHSHEDRTGGLEFLRKKGVKTFTSLRTDSICKLKNEKRAEFQFNKDTTFTVGQYTFQTFYAGEGHTPDNIVVWCEQKKILYGGCLVKSTESPDLGNIADANIQLWESTIKTLQAKYNNADYIITGHQDWRSKQSLDHTIQLLQQYKNTHKHK